MRYLLRRLAGPGRRTRFVRRIEIPCPHDPETTAEIDLLIGPTGSPAMVLRCNRRCEAPPECDQLCRTRAAAMTTPGVLLLLPPGEGPPEELD